MALKTVEVLRGQGPSPTADAMLKAMTQAIRKSGCKVRETTAYAGDSDLLLLFGVGAPTHAIARQKHVDSGRHALLFDLGYFSRKKITGYVRMTIDHDHPQAYIGRTTPKPGRWALHGIALREDYKADGPVILVGLGRKARSYLGEPDWEVKEYQRIKREYPGREIIYRPKPRHPYPPINCKVDQDSKIEDLLKGASLAACRHSNVAVDAIIAGVPFDAIDGAAMWMKGKDYLPETRLDFLRRLSYWQWKSTEADQCWKFAQSMLETHED